jgi:predicted small lipoprotein YifL
MCFEAEDLLPSALPFKEYPMKLKSLVLASVFALAACGGPLKYMPRGTEKAPGADAKIVAEVHKDLNNVRLDVTITSLTPPERLKEGAHFYVAWQRKNADTKWSRVATMKFDPESRVASFKETTVPESMFEFMVTCEEKTDAESPSAIIVIEQKVNM